MRRSCDQIIEHLPGPVDAAAGEEGEGVPPVLEVDSEVGGQDGLLYQ